MKSLSILIPTLPIRIDSYCKLMKKLIYQINLNNAQDVVQILTFCDTKEYSVGHKRNWLLENSVGRYVCFIDDDDDISDNYIKEILSALPSNSDCITFLGEYIDESKTKDFSISTMHFRDYNDTDTYYRLPNHLCPVKREIALQSMFTLKNFGEDSDYSKNINMNIKNEFHIKEKLYFYMFSHSESQTLPTILNKKTF